MTRAWRPVARLALRDARAHRARTLLAVLLVAVPLALVTGFLATQLTTSPTRQAALASVPDGAQALVTGTAVNPAEGPFPQLPEGAPGPWIDSLDVVPLSAAELADHLPERDTVHQLWDSEDLLAVVDPAAAPGTTEAASTADLGDVDPGAIATLTLREAGPEALTHLLPPLTEGTAPADDADIVLTTALAQRLDAQVGDVVTLIAPPFNGWYSTNGRVAEVLQDSRRTYRVTGLVTDDAPRAWALPGWLAQAVTADPAGVDTHFLVTGPDPVTWQTARQLNTAMAFAVSRHVLTSYPDDSELYPRPVSADYLATALVMTVVGCAAAVGLLLGLVTPAFVVAAEQQRRTLALAAATGATPRQLSRTMTFQGVAVGALGGLLGVGVGLVGTWAAYRLQRPEVQALAGLPGWLAPLCVAGAALAGWAATRAPARRVARLPLVDALRQGGQAERTGRAEPRRARRVLSGTVLLLAAAGCALASLRAPLPAVDPQGPPPVPGTLPGGASVPLLLAALVLAAVGLFLLAPAALELTARALDRGPLVLRMAARDVVTHRGRTLPVAGAVAVVTALACGQAVLLASLAANANDSSVTPVAPGHLALGPSVPVSDDLDATVVADAVATLTQAGLPVAGSSPVWSTSTSLLLDVEPPEPARCPEGTEPDTAASLGLVDEVTCVSAGQGYNPGIVTPWELGSQVLVMDGEALRATGLDGAQEAAAVLEAGGVVVNNATWLAEDGTVRVGLADYSTTAAVQDAQTRPGAFLRRMSATVTVSPATAAELGLTGEHAPVYVGELVRLTRPLTADEEAQVRRVVEERTDLVRVGLNWDLPPWVDSAGLLVLVVLAAVALVALVLNLLLARTQLRDELTTVGAVGAPPGFARRLMATHAAVVLAMGVPAGVLCGWAVAAYLVLWNRKVAVSGPWLRVEGAWAWQATAVAGFVAVGLAVAWLMGRPARDAGRYEV